MTSNNGSGDISSECPDDMASWEETMDTLYTYFYLFLFIPGLLLNTVALWVLCRHISKKMKTLIFMINLAFADLAHVLSLPLRIYYYFTLTWPFGRAACLFCFYLKYLNMYAAIVFLVCISVQRCVFLLKPFSARSWRKRYDLLISIIVWLGVGMACSPFILVRGGHDNNTSFNHSPYSSPTQASTAGTVPYGSHSTASPGSSPGYGAAGSPEAKCFKDLPTRKLSLSTAVTVMVLGELLGFLLPLAAIGYSSARIVHSLLKTQYQDPVDPLPRGRTFTITSSVSQTDSLADRQTAEDKRRALRMVLGCSALFLVCFAPYHVNFLLYLLVTQDVVSHCGLRLAVTRFHPVSLCLASLSCCLNPLLYYFLTAEFRRHLGKRASRLSSKFLSSPLIAAYSSGRVRAASEEA
ncbi:putative P2Y purinoceptor 10 [Gadus macrocephalus]|uniref:putative P2Y purinoceptor 10 n=1 Tax=Gadus macrocephalus TaxID=80720 RepID=UPI0028CB8FED|nr:putative P2Y purinoceptor 10 [Gadus macrocephalus]